VLVGVRPDWSRRISSAQPKDALQLRLVLEPRRHGRQGADEDLARGAVHADPVAFAEAQPALRAVRRLRRVLHDELGAAGHAGLADLAGDHRRVRRGAAARREDSLRHGHAVEVVGEVSTRTRTTFSPRATHSTATSALKTARPTAAPGDAFRP